MLKKITLALIAVLIAFLGFVAVQPPDYTVSRQITIHAPASKIFPYLNSSKLAEQWGPWLEVDPQAIMTYSGPDSGIGSKASWNSSGQLGTGSATIVDSVNNQKVAHKLEYTKPMSMNQDAEYLIQSSGDQSIVTWKVSGKKTFINRLVCAFMNMDMDKMVGGMFEKGLSNLKVLVEKSN